MGYFPRSRVISGFTVRLPRFLRPNEDTRQQLGNLRDGAEWERSSNTRSSDLIARFLR